MHENKEVVVFTYDQALEKYYHADVYNLPFPKKFDPQKASKLSPKDRIKYTKKRVPPKKIKEFLRANVK